MSSLYNNSENETVMYSNTCVNNAPIELPVVRSNRRTVQYNMTILGASSGAKSQVYCALQSHRKSTNSMNLTFGGKT
jgi:hypothetical protein